MAMNSYKLYKDLKGWDVDREYKDILGIDNSQKYDQEDIWNKNPNKSDDEFIKFWRLRDHISRLSMNRNRRYALIREVVAYVTQNNFEANDVLDYGCGTGELGIMMATLGYNTDFLEVSDSEAIKYVKERCKRRYLNCGFLDHDKELPRKYDIVFLIDVLEHCLDPVFVINNILRHLKTNGIMIFSFNTTGHGADRVTQEFYNKEVKPIISREFEEISDTFGLIYRKK